MKRGCLTIVFTRKRGVSLSEVGLVRGGGLEKKLVGRLVIKMETRE